MTHTVLKSAMVMSAWVGSLIMSPGATESAVMLPLMVAATTRRCDLSAEAPNIFRRACVRVYSASAWARSLFAWSRSLSEAAPIPC